MRTNLHPTFGLRHSAVTALGTAFLAAFTLFTTTPRAPALGLWGDALSFNGTSNYVVMPSGTWFGNQFTIEAWVYERAYAGFMRTLDFGNAQCSDSILLCQYGGNGQPAFIIFYDGSSSQVVAGPQPLPLNQWVHLAATFTNNTGILYVNGFPVATNSAMPPPNSVTRTNNYIARSNWAGDPAVNAIIDDVRIWNVARGPSDIAAHLIAPLTGTESNLVAYWKFDEGSGAIAHDATTNGYNGTLVNGPQWTPSTIPLWGNALSLNGTNQYMSVPPGTWFSNNLSIEAWVYEQSYNNYAQVLDFGNGAPSDNVKLALSSGTTGQPYFEVDIGSTVHNFTAPVAIPTNQWVHLAATLQGTLGTIYVNGVVVATNTLASPNAVNRTNNYVGRSNWSANYYANAIFDELRIWNAARTAGQIQNGMCQPLTGTESNLVAYWRFDELAGNTAHDTTTNHFDGALVNGPVFTNSAIPPFVNINAGLPGVCGFSVFYGANVAAVWGDYNNDGKLDILLTGGTNVSSLSGIAQVWRNNGDGTFSNINAGLPGVNYSAAAWGDYNNDGLLDILLTGEEANGNYITQVWRNNGDGTFSNINAGLPGICSGAVAWGDYDNDGLLDILLTGGNGNGNYITQVWRNNGDNTFSNINAGLPNGCGSAVWGDYDNDGLLDILLTGGNGNDTFFTQVWRNNGDNTFSNINAGLPGASGQAVWGDYDNDGRLDILLTGVVDANLDTITEVWRNNGDNTFSNINAGLPGESFGSVAWGDYDNDGRLDILLTGTIIGDPVKPVAQVWRNLGPVTNTPPTAPANPAASVAACGVSLSWGAANDAQTPATGLSYNLRVGTASGAGDIVSPQANAT